MAPPCLESQGIVLAGLGQAVARCLTTEQVLGPVARAVQLVIPSAAHVSVELPVLPNVLLSTQNLTQEGQCSLMFYSLSNTLAGHVYTTRAAASACPKPRRRDKQALDVDYLNKQLKMHHQLTIPVVLDSNQRLVARAQEIQKAAPPGQVCEPAVVNAIMDEYLTLCSRAPVMGAVTVGASKALTNREVANLCLVASAMSTYLASDWQNFFDIADPRTSTSLRAAAHRISPGGKPEPIPRRASSSGNPDNEPLAAAHNPNVQRVSGDEEYETDSSDEYEYGSETDTDSTQSDAAFDGTMRDGLEDGADSASKAVDRKRAAPQDGCREMQLRTVRRRPDDSDPEDEFDGPRGPSHSQGSQGSTMFGGTYTGATSSRGVGSASRTISGTSRGSSRGGTRSGNTRHRATGLPSVHEGDAAGSSDDAKRTSSKHHRASTTAVNDSSDNVGLLLQWSDCAADAQFRCFFSHQFLLNDQLLCIMSMLVFCMLAAFNGVSRVLTSNPWQLAEFATIMACGASTILASNWYLRHRETLLLLRWLSTITLHTLVVLPTMINYRPPIVLCACGASCILFACVSPLRFSTVLPLLLLQLLAMLMRLPQVCVLTMTGGEPQAVCMMRTVALFLGIVVMPACSLSYVTEMCSQKAFRYFRSLNLPGNAEEPAHAPLVM